MRLFDLHCDTLTYLCYRSLPLLDGEAQLNLSKGRFLDAWTQMLAVFVPDGLRGAEAVAYYEKNVAYRKAQLSLNRDFRLHNGATPQLLLSVESGAALGGRIENVRRLAEDGVRMMTLTWNGENELGFGRNTDRGLKPFGFDVLREMETCGIVADVSHLSDKGFDDVASASEKPFVATHSNSRAVCNHPRNLTDEQFGTIRDRGGLVGINFFDEFVLSDGGDYMTALLKHIEHFLSLGGERCVCIGSDYDGAQINECLDSLDKLPRLWEALQKIGYSDALIDRIFYQNAADFFEREGK